MNQQKQGYLLDEILRDQVMRQKKCPYNFLTFYGIYQEHSDIRAHVSPVTKMVFAYRTKDMLEVIQQRKFKRREAYQDGVKWPTGYGLLVPYNLAVNQKKIVYVLDFANRYWWDNFSGSWDTARKGKYAVSVIRQIIIEGKFPLWIQPEFKTDVKTDIEGTDILVVGNWRIQVKLDQRAGPREKGGTGNLFIQTHEMNPLRKY